MTGEEFDRVLDYQLNRVRQLLSTKATEYATEDRLHNFKVAAELQGTTARQALGGMMAKHTVSIYDMIDSPGAFTNDLWDEKITDHINYLILLKAIVEEE